MSKQNNIEITPNLKGTHIIGIPAETLNDIQFYKDFVGYYFNKTNKKCWIEFAGSKGYFHSINFYCEAGGFISDEEINKFGFVTSLTFELLESKNFQKLGLIDFYDTPRGIVLKVGIHE